MAGKGDKTRPTNGDKYRENFDRIFSGKPKPEKPLTPAQKREPA